MVALNLFPLFSKSLQSAFNSIPTLGVVKKEGVFKNNPPIFIVGPPRSGTTLIYQLLVSGFHFAYINNLMAAFPSLMVPIFRLFFDRSPGVARSKYGYIPGLLAPNEAGAIMRLWFSDTRNEEACKVRDVIATLSYFNESSFISKNLFNVLRINEIRSIFPEAVFIRVKRDPRYVVQSIYRSRLALDSGNAKSWWSVAPEGYEEITEESPIFQSAWQVSAIESILDGLVEDDSSTCIQLDYHNLCSAPHQSLNSLAGALDLPQRFRNTDFPIIPNEDKVKVTEGEWQEILCCVEKHFPSVR